MYVPEERFKLNQPPLKIQATNGKIYTIPNWLPYFEKIRDFYSDCEEIVNDHGEVEARESFLDLALRDLKVTETWIKSRVDGLKTMYVERKKLADSMYATPETHHEGYTALLMERSEVICEFEDELRHFREQKYALQGWIDALNGRFGDLDGPDLALYGQIYAKIAKQSGSFGSKKVEELNDAERESLAATMHKSLSATMHECLGGLDDPSFTAKVEEAERRAKRAENVDGSPPARAAPTNSPYDSDDDIPLSRRNPRPEARDGDSFDLGDRIFGKWDPEENKNLRDMVLSGRNLEKTMQKYGDYGVSLFELAIYVTTEDIKRVKAAQNKHKIVLVEMELEMRRKKRQPGDREVPCTDDLLASAIASAEAGIECLGNQAAKNVQHIKCVITKMTMDQVESSVQEIRALLFRFEEHDKNLHLRLDEQNGLLKEAMRKVSTLKSSKTKEKEAKRLSKKKEVDDQRRRAKELYEQREREAQDARERAKGVERLNLWCRRHRIEQQKKREQAEAAAAQRIREERLKAERAQRDAMRIQINEPFTNRTEPFTNSQTQPNRSRTVHDFLTRAERAHRDGFSNRCKGARSRDFNLRQDVERDAAAERRRLETVQKEKDQGARRAKAEAVRTQTRPQGATIASVIDDALSQRTKKNDIPMAKTVSVELGAGLGLGLYPELDALALGVPIVQGERFVNEP